MESDADESEQAFILHKWQKCYFQLQDEKSDPRSKVDAISGILQQIHQSKTRQIIRDDVYSQLARQYIKSHAAIVDSVNSQTGLNNYADSALTICANHPNESSEWTTSLTPDNLRNLPCIRRLLQSSKTSSEEAQKTAHLDKPLQLKAWTRPSLNTNQQSIIQPNRPASFTSHPQGQSSTNQGSHDQQPGQVQVIRRSSESKTSHQPLSGGPLAASAFKDGMVPRLPQGQASVPRDQVPAFVSKATAVRGATCKPQPQGQWTGATGSGYIRDPSGSSGFTSNQSSKPGVFASSTAQNNSLKRKAVFQEVEYSGDGQLPFRTSVPEHAGFTDKRFSGNQGARPRNEDNFEDDEIRAMPRAFKTAGEQLMIQNQKKYGNRGGGGAMGGASSSFAYGTNKKSLGTTRRGLNSKFIPPIMNRDEEENERGFQGRQGVSERSKVNEEEVTDERLKGIEPKMIELVMNEIMDHGPPIHWDDIAGLEFAKTTIKEIVVWPMLRPDIFKGLRGPPKGLLLFGPPGTGKTLIGKCIACQSGATFFSISASSLTSKWVGEGEKMVRALFAVARCYQPAVIFIDEIDSLLSQRSNDEHESSRRIKTEFLVQLDGATTSSEDRLLVVGATNRPQEIDEAARRRLVKRLYIPLPDAPARKQIIQNLLAQQSYSLTEEQLSGVCLETEGYSGADMANLCREAALGPIRCIQGTDIQHISADQVRPILYQDFSKALQHVRPSVSKSDLNIYLEWNKTFGSGASK